MCPEDERHVWPRLLQTLREVAISLHPCGECRPTLLAFERLQRRTRAARELLHRFGIRLEARQLPQAVELQGRDVGCRDPEPNLVQHVARVAVDREIERGKLGDALGA